MTAKRVASACKPRATLAAEREDELCTQCGHDPCVCHVITPDWLNEANREIRELQLV